MNFLNQTGLITYLTPVNTIIYVLSINLIGLLVMYIDKKKAKYGRWRIPENARVAAAGNDLEDSLAANTMAEPLFNRFNHVYINTTVDDWLNWALTPNDSYERLDYKKEDISKQLKIHPAIWFY